MKKVQEFTGTSKDNLLEALKNAIKQAENQLGGGNIPINWRLEKVQGEIGGVVGPSLSVTISVKRG